ncbi:hypothetical protein SKAU_G00426150 [Synaphobranchus kaupii]|uniref:Zinc finger protein 513 n=1 Tax=Synaphobranchus kaupii TaxID=118154 RepID=A0A9Q1E569_SYNKA|nr:hypothetical protein SKAU_G00426150 [Synaphobranchus kaupii]
MPRRKQLNPQPVKLDSEDPASFVLESDFLLERHLQFDENDTEHQILEPERGGADAAELIGLEVFPLCFTPLSMESQADHAHDPDSEPEEGGSCARCGQLLSLAGPYCPRCGDRKGWGVSSDPASQANDDEDDALDGGEEDGDDPPKLHSCKQCSFTSRYSNHLKRHMKTHNGDKPYRCPLCAYASAQLVNLQRHLRIHTGEKPYSCAHCDFACSSLGNLKRHQRMHTHDQQMHVPEQRSNSNVPLDRHAIGQAVGEGPAEEAVLRSLHHGDQLNRGNDRPQDAGGGGAGGVANALPELLFPFTCRLCGVVLEDEDGTSAQICGSCTLEMLSKATAGSPGERGDRVFSCSLCPFTTQYPNHLARHMKTHSGEKPYKCPQCDYASAHFDNLKRHHRVHTGEKPYKCHLCDYACGNLANLKRHQRIHSGAKPFQCAVCSYSCNQSMNLKRHMLRHTGEKPFSCQECPYTTGHWDNYKRHQRKHGHSAHGWVKVQLPDNEEEEDEEEEEDV